MSEVGGKQMQVIGSKVFQVKGPCNKYINSIRGR